MDTQHAFSILQCVHAQPLLRITDFIDCSYQRMNIFLKVDLKQPFAKGAMRAAYKGKILGTSSAPSPLVHASCPARISDIILWTTDGVENSCDTYMIIFHNRSRRSRKQQICRTYHPSFAARCECQHRRPPPSLMPTLNDATARTIHRWRTYVRI